jgi:hypothetical protein
MTRLKARQEASLQIVRGINEMKKGKGFVFFKGEEPKATSVRLSDF